MSSLTQQVLRITTAGSVDDGKSTLIGRLLYESRAVLDDQWEALQKARLIQGQPDLSLLTDGLKSEREQGITIDVAYKYFASTKRKFILADAPGHVQYTRNMVTAASRADVAIILVDARQGVIEQTRRHSYLIAQLGVPHVILAINKIDAIDYDQERIEAIDRDFRRLAWVHGAQSLHSLPLSALLGDNVSSKSSATPWYKGPSLLELLETLPSTALSTQSPYLPVQLILRDRSGQRLASGTLRSGPLKLGDEVTLWPSQQKSHIRSLWVHGQNANQAQAGDAIAVSLDDERDLERGSLILAEGQQPKTAQAFNAELVWFDEEAQRLDERYLLRLGSQTTRAQIVQIAYRFDLEQLAPVPSTQLQVNDVARVKIESSRLLAIDTFADDKYAGAFILIDPRSFRTVAAGIIKDIDGQNHRSSAVGSLRLVDHFVEPSEIEGERILQIPRNFLQNNTADASLKIIESLWELGWHVHLEQDPLSESLQKRLIQRGLGTFEHGLGI